MGTTGDESSIAIRISAFTYHRIESRKNSIERVFFRCAIQATDSTFTGCRAKIKAAKKAPGMDNSRIMAQIKSAPAMCRMRFVAW